ncbi:MAG: hypothetical protein AAFW01_20380, partial [Pseudomonadota bacterium]
EDLWEILAVARSMVTVGAPLTALILLKQVFHERWSDDAEERAPIIEGLVEVYEALGRPSLAARVKAFDSAGPWPGVIEDIEYQAPVPGRGLAGLPEIGT